MPEPRPAGYLDWAERLSENPEALLNLRQGHHQLPARALENYPESARERRAGQIVLAGGELEALGADSEVPLRLRKLLTSAPEVGVLERLDLIAGITWSQTGLWRRRCLQRGAARVLERYPKAAQLEALVLDLLADEARTGGRFAGFRAELRGLGRLACLLVLITAAAMMAAGARAVFLATLEALDRA